MLLLRGNEVGGSPEMLLERGLVLSKPHSFGGSFWAYLKGSIGQMTRAKVETLAA